MVRVLASLAAVSILGLGCGEPAPASVTVQVEKEVYSTSMFADATVSNDDARAINFSPCETRLQFFDPTPNDWTEGQTRTGCTDELRVVNPNESSSFTWFLNRALPGRYRFEVRVRIGDRVQPVQSNEFRVE